MTETDILGHGHLQTGPPARGAGAPSWPSSPQRRASAFGPLGFCPTLYVGPSLRWSGPIMMTVGVSLLSQMETPAGHDPTSYSLVSLQLSPWHLPRYP